MRFLPSVRPLPARTTTLVHRVQTGETLASICGAWGQPEWAYPDLVAANNRYELALPTTPRNSYELKLRAGDVLVIPDRWKPDCAPCALGSIAQGGRLGGPFDWIDLVKKKELIEAGLKDAELSAQTVQILHWVAEGMQGFPNIKNFEHAKTPLTFQPAISNAVVQWYQQMYPNQKPTFATIVPLFDSAAEWAKLYSQQMRPVDAGAMPWTEVNWWVVSKFFPFLQLPVDWGRVKRWAQSTLSAADLVLVDRGPLPPWQEGVTNWAKEPFLSWPWGKIPWSDIPFEVLPLTKLDPAKLPALAPGSDPQATKDARTQGLLEQLAQVYGKPKPAPEVKVFLTPKPTTLFYTPGLAQKPAESTQIPPKDTKERPKGELSLPGKGPTLDAVLSRYGFDVKLVLERVRPTPAQIGTIENAALSFKEFPTKIRSAKDLEDYLGSYGMSGVPQDKPATFRWTALGIHETTQRDQNVKIGDTLASGTITIPARAKKADNTPLIVGGVIVATVAAVGIGVAVTSK